MPPLPSGTVAFLFTDIEGSTWLLGQHPDQYRRAVRRHHDLLREAVQSHGGVVFETVGDAVYAAFDRPTDAVAAALAGQLALHAEPWGDVGPVNVRMAIHVGEVELQGTHYVGLPLYRCGRLMDAAQGEQTLLSAATVEVVRDALPAGASLRDLGEHRLRDLQRPERVFQLVHGQLRTEFPPLVSRHVRPNNLPPQANPLIGRDLDVHGVRSLLVDPDLRLLTIMGPAGVGKTRLAIEVAARLLASFADGAFFVDLASIDDPALVPAAIARALGVQELGKQRLIVQLQQYLGSKQILLVLDNFEQVVATARDVADLLACCPELKILVTSRVPLQLRWEHQLPLPPLALPDLERLPEPGAVAGTAAVALFCERARAVKPDFALTNDNARAVAEICHRLDGLPLAIELCAAQVDVLSTSVILEGLRRSGLDLLEGGAQDLPARHHTLRTAIGWSDRLLDTNERTTFSRLAVFLGGCTPVAADLVCSLPSDRQIRVSKAIASLVRKSLLRLEQSANGDGRIRMLEMVREYAAEQLRASGEELVLRGRHRDWCLALAEEADADLRGRKQREWLDRLEAEHDNLRAALSWCLRELDSAQVALRLAGALAWFWRLHGHMSDGRRWLGAALEASERTRPARPRALNGAGLLAYAQGDYGAAQTLLEESLALAQELGDTAAVAWAYHGLGRVRYGQRDHERAIAAFEESLRWFADADDTGGSAYSFFFWGCVERDGGDHERAAALYAQCLARAQESGDTWILAFVHYITANLAWLQGEVEQAVALYKEGLVLADDIQAKWPIAECLWGLTGLAARVQPERAARLYGAERGLRQALGAVLLGDASVYEPALAAARAALGEAAFTAAAAEGRAMPLDRAIAYALAEQPMAKTTTASAWPGGAEPAERLTPREHEVALLVARGLTNRQIGEQLVITKQTADRHVSNILSKLGATSRAQVAAWVVEQRLLPAVIA